MGTRGGEAPRTVFVRRLMLVRVMPEMLGSGTLLVLAIGARRRPDGLEWQDQHQEDEEKALHCGQ